MVARRTEKEEARRRGFFFGPIGGGAAWGSRIQLTFAKQEQKSRGSLTAGTHYRRVSIDGCSNSRVRYKMARRRQERCKRADKSAVRPRIRAANADGRFLPL